MRQPLESGRATTHRAGHRKALLAAAADFFARSNQEPRRTLSIIGSKPAIVV